MLPHLRTAGAQELPKRLDGADLVVLYQLPEAVKHMLVSCNDKQPFCVLSDDKMAAPVVTPVEEKHRVGRVRFRFRSGFLHKWKVSLVGQDITDGLFAKTNQKTTHSLIFQLLFHIPEANGAEKQLNTYRQMSFKHHQHSGRNRFTYRLPNRGNITKYTTRNVAFYI